MTKKRIVFWLGPEKWAVNADVVARDRAKYYALRESGIDRHPDDPQAQDTYNKVYLEEFDFTLNDDMELGNWIANNMYFADIAEYAEVIDTEIPVIDYEAAFSRAEFDIE